MLLRHIWDLADDDDDVFAILLSLKGMQQFSRKKFIEKM